MTCAGYDNIEDELTFIASRINYIRTMVDSIGPAVYEKYPESDSKRNDIQILIAKFNKLLEKR